MKKLVIKYLTDTISEAELASLKVWLKSSKNEEQFKAMVKANHKLDSIYKSIDTEAAYKVLLESVQHKRTIAMYKQPWFKYAAAASIALLISITAFFNKNESASQSVEPIIVNNNIQTGTDKATLTLEDGSNVTLIKGQLYQSQNVSSNGEELIYNSNATTKEIAYNYLTIPRGGQFYIKLSDGTEVWLNSESQLKYPVSFIDGKTRQVELVYGEAYFDVSPSTEHNGATFKVFNQSQEIEVLGTEFNIKAYKDETNIYTTLVEGKVTISNSITSQNLVPGQQSNFNLETNDITIITVDIYNETSWKKGIFSFKDKPLKDIMKVLSRWYDTDIVFTNKSLENINFNGVLSKEQNIENILSTIKLTNNNINYDIKDKTITIR